VSPSASALSRIATVFRLTAAERDYLFHLAGRVDPEIGEASTDNQIFGPLIDGFISAISVPAYLLDRYYSPIAWNEHTAILFNVWLAGLEKNLLRHVFLDPTARNFLIDWELRACQLLAQFRIDYTKHIDDPQMVELVKGLHEESDFFRKIWNDHHVLFREGNERSYIHPALGKLTYFQNTFAACSDPSTKLVILYPLGERQA